MEILVKTKRKVEADMRRQLTRLVLLSSAIVFSQAARAESWQVTAGAQSPDKASQALAFLPNEIGIHAGDTITWTFPVLEPHTVTFLTAGQVRPSAVAGCPGTTASNLHGDISGAGQLPAGLLGPREHDSNRSRSECGATPSS